LSFLALAYRLLRWLARQLGWGGRRLDDSDADLGSSVVLYRRLMLLLASAGLRRPPAETPREFARRAAEALLATGLESTTASEVPGAVVEGFYRVRFGRQALPEAEVRRLDSALELLEVALRPNANRPGGQDSRAGRR
jgi:hypothetical protein